MSISNNIKAVKRNANKLFKSPFFRAKIQYAKYYRKLAIKEDEVLIESYAGSSISGSGYQLLLEILKDSKLKEFKIYVACHKNEIENIQKFLESKGITKTKCVITHSKPYVRCLAQAKYLVNNATFASYFIKKPGQIYYNSWHGTPLKTLGRAIASAPHEIGNTQRNFFMADYLLYPNQFTFTHMKEDYMLDNFYKGKYVLSGYPRNGAFYNEKVKTQIREELDLQNTEVICYMPTWRGTLDKKNNEEQYIYIMYYLYQLDNALSEDKILYVKLHNYVSSRIKFRDFKHIRPFPTEYETYEFLSIADCLITDYSSVFFDFANTNKKIILFAYDKAQYLADRGMYIDMDALPFPIVETVDDLIVELRDLQAYPSYQNFRDIYCNYDSIDAGKKIVDLIFHNKESADMEVIDGSVYANDKENILIYGGALSKNGITTSLRGLLKNIDLEKRNYTVLLYRNMVKNDAYVIRDFPDHLSYISIQGQKLLSLKEAFVHYAYFRMNVNNRWVYKQLKNIYEREIVRVLPQVKFDYAIHFTGYEKHIANLFQQLDCRKVIYAHNNMVKEKSTKSNYHFDSISNAYKKFDHIVCVRESMKEEIMSIVPNAPESKVKIVHNVNNIEHIKQQAMLPITFNEDTFSTHSIVEIEEILNRKDCITFINIARFSIEKGIDRLIKAFEIYEKENPNAYLIVIGGLGVLFDEILEYVQTRKMHKVVIIRSLNNPFPILTNCDAFVLSSLYEGLPMSIMEALILNIPVISTDITGPREFLQQGYGHLVKDSMEGILEGFRMFTQGELENKEFDAEAFNQQAIEEFYSIFEE